MKGDRARSHSPQPPRLARWLLGRRSLGPRRAEVEGDLEELFAARVAALGRRRAARRYYADVLSVWMRRPSPIKPARLKRGGALDAMAQDVLFALRIFRRQPGLVALTVAGLGLAIAISTVVFSIANGIALRAPGIADPDRVVSIELRGIGTRQMHRISSNSPMSGNVPYAHFAAFASAARSLTTVASIDDWLDVRWLEGQNGLPMRIAAVSGDYFEVLGAGMHLGQRLNAADDGQGSSRRAVLSHVFWKNVLAADPAIVGRTIWLEDTPFTVIGVTARRFVGAPFGWDNALPALWITFGAHADLWQDHVARQSAALRRQMAGPPTAAASAADAERLVRLTRELETLPTGWNPPVDMLARLRPGITPAQAQAEASTLATGVAARFSAVDADGPPRAILGPIADPWSAETWLLTAIIGGIIGLVVVLACTNVANLLLASATARRREISTRFALGAGRGRIVRQLMTESLILGAAGGAVGLLLAIWTVPVFAMLVRLPPLVDVAPDVRVFGFVVLLTMATGVIAGLAPARTGRRIDLATALKSDPVAAPNPIPARRLRSVLVGGQAAASILLLVMASLFVRSALQAAHRDPGVDVDRLLTVSVNLGRGYDAEGAARYWDATLARLRALPGVANAALASMPPFGGSTVPSMPNGRFVNRNETTPEYFATMGLRLERGRVFTTEEMRSQATVALISANLAREFWGDASPIGDGLDRVWGEPDGPDSRQAGTIIRRPANTTIVGVVSDSVGDISRPDAGTIYLPLSSAAVPRLVVAAEGDPAALIRTVTDVLRSIEPDASVSVTLMRDGLQRELEAPRMLALLTAIIGSSALLLAGIGLFGVTAFVVGQRRNEVSLRLVLGATLSDVTRLLVRDSLRPVTIGLAAGLIAALIGGQLLQAALYGISARDPIAIVIAAIVLTATALVAVLVPVRQVAKVEPAEMLKRV